MAANATLIDLTDVLLPSDHIRWEKAACAGDPNQEAWFPFPSQSFEYARDVCNECPIRTACGQYAEATGQSGVWGGRDYDCGRVVRD